MMSILDHVPALDPISLLGSVATIVSIFVSVWVVSRSFFRTERARATLELRKELVDILNEYEHRHEEFKKFNSWNESDLRSLKNDIELILRKLNGSIEKAILILPPTIIDESWVGNFDMLFYCNLSILPEKGRTRDNEDLIAMFGDAFQQSIYVLDLEIMKQFLPRGDSYLAMKKLEDRKAKFKNPGLLVPLDSKD